MRRPNVATSSVVRAVIALACAAVTASGRPLFAGTVVPAEPDHVVSLNGTWRFKLERAIPTSSAQSATGRVLPVDNPQTFEPFYRPDAARTRSDGGVGLGLHLCRMIAAAHGGRLEIRNARPGLAVTLRLPVT